MVAGRASNSPPQRVWEVLVLGSGFSGIAAAVQLDRASIHDYAVLERGVSVGGTWRDNHYPGCACDIPSVLYSFSFELSSDWSRTFATQPEIQRYLQHVSDKRGVTPKIRFNTNVTSARWLEDEGVWEVTTEEVVPVGGGPDGKAWSGEDHGRGIAGGGDSRGRPVDGTDPKHRIGGGGAPAGAAPGAATKWRARSVIHAMGALCNPIVPEIEGIETFRGPVFHSAQWRHDVDLAGKRVAVVGTGASAIQLIPEVAKLAARVDVFQRTPPWILPKPDRPYTWIEKALFRYVPGLSRLARLVAYTALEFRAFAFVYSQSLLSLAERQSKRSMRAVIKDPELLRKVTPSYRLGCKRVLLTNNYFQTLVQPHVSLFSGEGEGIARATPDGIVDTSGRLHEADVVIFGTGFDIHSPFKVGAFFGRGGVDVARAIEVYGAQAYKGTLSFGIPNFFTLMGANTGLGHNSQVFMVECQLRYVIDCLVKMRKNGWKTVEPKLEVQEAWNKAIQGRAGTTVWNSGGCRSWYLNDKGVNDTLWPGFTFTFANKLRKFDSNKYVIDGHSDSPGYEISSSWIAESEDSLAAKTK